MTKPMVLVVDDESTTRRLVAFTLKPMNIEVVGAEDGLAALALMEQRIPDLIIVDINLPGMDGFSLMEQLNALPHLQDIPFIAYTARNTPDDVHRARNLGASGFLYKPFTTTELRSVVNDNLRLDAHES